MILKLTSFIFFALLLACSSTNQDKSSGQIDSQSVPQGSPGINHMVDEDISTRFVSEFSEADSLTLISGSLGYSGNEPFARLTLFTNEASYWIRASSEGIKWMEKMTGKPVSFKGVVKSLGAIKVLKVYEVKK